MNLILIFKALHVVGFISWFAGLFYLGRVLVNHAEAVTQPTPEGDEQALLRHRIRGEVLHEEYSATEDRVYKIIVNPAMMITWAAGLVMIIANTSYFVAGTPGWLHLKLLLLVLMVVYQIYTKVKLMRPMQAGEHPFSGWQLRLWNEAQLERDIPSPSKGDFQFMMIKNHSLRLCGRNMLGSKPAIQFFSTYGTEFFTSGASARRMSIACR
jgi:putative membrane protein